MRRIGSEVQYQFWCITICTLSALGCSTQIGDGDTSNTAPLAASSRHATFKTLVTWTCPADTGCAGQSGTMNPFDQGCGNTHYAANSRNSYDMANTASVLTRCEHYGLHDGPGGKDLQTLFNSSTWGQYGQKYGNDGNGGGWQIYLFQSFPGYHNKATLPDGTKIKNFWPYLYY